MASDPSHGNGLSDSPSPRDDGGHDIRLGDVRILITRAGLEYFIADSWEVTEVDADNFQVRVGPVRLVNSPVGTYMLVVTPNGPDAIPALKPLLHWQLL